MNHAGPSNTPRGLPTTIEEATRRYLMHYKSNFCGSAADQIRLQNLAESFIYRLRKIAPRFYEDRLPTFVNQACQALLCCETDTKEGNELFHKTHGQFLSILNDFKESQPAGEVNFASERNRHEAKTNLKMRRDELTKRLNELDALEIDTDEIGEDEDLGSSYAKIFAQKESIERDLSTVSLEIAMIEGVDIEPEVSFKLRVLPRSHLASLTQDEIKKLEKQMFDFILKHKDRTAFYVDISVVAGMFEKLQIAPDRFAPVFINTLMREALDAYRAYFRDQEKEARNEYLDGLLRSKHLLPKEGAILDPNDLPDDVRERLDANDLQGRQEIGLILETFMQRQGNSEKELGDELNDPGDEPVDEKAEAMKRLEARGIKLERIKEEPRDDCNMREFLLPPEDLVDAEVADALIASGDAFESHESDDYDVDEREGAVKPRKLLKRDVGGSDGTQNSDERSISNEEEEDEEDDHDEDEDIEFLGTVEPSDKIKLYQLTE